MRKRRKKSSERCARRFNGGNTAALWRRLWQAPT